MSYLAHGAKGELGVDREDEKPKDIGARALQELVYPHAQLRQRRLPSKIPAKDSKHATPPVSIF